MAKKRAKDGVGQMKFRFEGKPRENLVAPSEHLKKELRPNSYEIIDGATGYDYERIFGPYMVAAETITVEDPFIRNRHQIENFRRFCALAIGKGCVKSIVLKTKADYGSSLDEADSELETLKRDLQERNIQLQWSRSEHLHDREIRFSNGWTVKVGRGLDIYYPPKNRASVDAANLNLRRCHQTKVDVIRHEMP